MLKPLGNPLIVAIEGVDGSGKSTSIHLVKKELESKGLRVGVIDLPDRYNSTGSLIHGILKSGNRNNYSPYYIASLFALNRYETIKNITINKLVTEQDVLIFDRYFLSNLIYGLTSLNNKYKDDRHKRNIERNKFSTWLSQYEYFYLDLPKPHLNIIINSHITISHKFLSNRKNSDLAENNIDYIQKLGEEYFNFNAYSLIGSNIGRLRKINNYRLNQGKVIPKTKDEMKDLIFKLIDERYREYKYA